ncbi:hypothetical protein VNO80_21448 [Phaseolus coccineus]|uniref:Uncharacterized protein n=1 Tax=Phaseolus coccineus TaxID=3886 RepID=A0AAN9QTC4_PHACN
MRIGNGHRVTNNGWLKRLSILGKKKVENGEGSKRKMEKEKKAEGESGKVSLEGLPIEDSPYVKYKDLEDYKQQGYGTQGHQEPKTGRGAGATEAPTLSGAAPSSQSQTTATGATNHKGLP